VTAIGLKLSVDGCEEAELKQLEQTVMPEQVLKEIAERRKRMATE